MLPRAAPASRLQRRTTAGALVVLGVILAASLPDPAARPSPLPSADVRLRIDPNVASRDELMLLPRIGPVLADAIIDYRNRCAHPPAFRRPEDLDHVYRIGPRTVERLRPHLSFASVVPTEVAVGHSAAGAGGTSR